MTPDPKCTPCRGGPCCHGEQSEDADSLELFALRAEVASLRVVLEQAELLVEGFTSEVEAAEVHLRRPKGGQQCTPSGDFVYCNPSTVGRLRWWAREFAAAIRARGTKGDK